MEAAPLLVLVGPAATGKSTVGRGVAARLGRPFTDLDAVADTYYREVGWSVARLRERITALGRVAAEREWEPARVHAMRRVLADHPGAVVALGAGHTSYADPRHAAQVRAALRPCTAVHLLLPAADPERALTVLRRRSMASKGTDWITDGHDFLAQWLHDPMCRAVATHVVCTEGDTPEQSIDHVLRLLPAHPGGPV